MMMYGNRNTSGAANVLVMTTPTDAVVYVVISQSIYPVQHNSSESFSPAQRYASAV